ncbi:Metallo-dependent phosphatase-like protein [Gautieria morchelliformis]|nr:Metallo-dependent phosphatase-like protein [Gautieria morchelliformis]
MTFLDSRLRRATKSGLIGSFRLIWIAVVLWCERGIFVWSLLGCRWPDKNLTLNNPALATHILLIADPQILDHDSYPGRPQWLKCLTQYIVDFNLRKNWNAVIATLEPHMVIFLGDMMDNGRSTIDESAYDRYYARFRSIFQLDSSTPVYYLPGNHDVDLGYSSELVSKPRDGYKDNFGPLNQRIDIGNHTALVLFDAPELVDEDYRRHAAQLDFWAWQGSEGGAVQFLKNFIKHRPTGPIVLFSHIPLFRSDRASCGPLRERGTIHAGVGRGYQNLLLRETSSFILENIRPAVVFSGDDHDYCECHHRLEDGSVVREISVKSFSMAMGIRRPGFQLLSVAPANHGGGHLPYDALADVPCLLPDQIKIYTHGYAPLGVVTVFLLFFINYNRRRRRRRLQDDTAWMETAQSYAYSFSGSNEPSTYAKLRHSPEHSVSLAQSTPINNSDDHGDEDWPDLPLAGSYMNPPELGDLSSLPYPAQYPPHPRWTRTPRIRALDTPFSGGHRLSAFLRRVQTCRTWWRGVDQQTWYSIAIKDFYAVAWPPLSVYIIISVWLFRR